MASKKLKAPQIAGRTEILARIARAAAPTETAAGANVLLAAAAASAQPGQAPELPVTTSAQEARDARDQQYKVLNKAMALAGYPEVLVMPDGDGWCWVLLANGDEVYPEALRGHTAFAQWPSPWTVEVMAEKFRELLPEQRLYAAGKHPDQEPQVAHPLNDMNPTADWAPGGRTKVDLPPPPPDEPKTFKLQVGTMDDVRIAIRKTDEHDQPMEDWRPEPIYDLAEARALPDVTGGVYTAAAKFAIDSPLAIRAFKDHDGRSMAVVWTGDTLAKAAITD